LRAAQRNPDPHRDLVVRITDYSALSRAEPVRAGGSHQPHGALRVKGGRFVAVRPAENPPDSIPSRRVEAKPADE